MRNRLPPLLPVLRAASQPCPPWAALFREAAQILHPPQEGEMDPDEARAMCRPWTVRVGTSIIRVIYEDPPTLPEEMPA